MGRVHRRTVILGLAATGALSACSRPAPTKAPAPAPSTPGPISGTAPAGRFSVGVKKLALRRGTDRPLPTTIWQPKQNGRYPLILFSHGLTASPAGYAELLTAWARAGFVVAAPAYPPQLFVHGKRDETVPYADGLRAYDAVPWPKAFLTVTAGGHITSGDALDVVSTTSAEFWRWSLYGDRAAKARLPQDAERGGLATLLDKL